MQTDVTAQEHSTDKKSESLVLVAAAGGHALSHFLYQGFLVALPTIRAALGLGPVQVGAIMTARELSAGLASLPGGMICDRLQRHWGIILAACMAGFGLGWLMVGISVLALWNSALSLSFRASASSARTVATSQPDPSISIQCGPPRRMPSSPASECARDVLPWPVAPEM